jgi:hypothetical protein
VRRADNLITFMCRLSINSGVSASWNPKGLSRPVEGNLYLLQFNSHVKVSYYKIFLVPSLIQKKNSCYTTTLRVLSAPTDIYSYVTDAYTHAMSTPTSNSIFQTPILSINLLLLTLTRGMIPTIMTHLFLR